MLDVDLEGVAQIEFGLCSSTDCIAVGVVLDAVLRHAPATEEAAVRRQATLLVASVCTPPVPYGGEYRGLDPGGDRFLERQHSSVHDCTELGLDPAQFPSRQLFSNAVLEVGMIEVLDHGMGRSLEFQLDWIPSDSGPIFGRGLGLVTQDVEFDLLDRDAFGFEVIQVVLELDNTRSRVPITPAVPSDYEVSAIDGRFQRARPDPQRSARILPIFPLRNPKL